MCSALLVIPCLGLGRLYLYVVHTPPGANEALTASESPEEKEKKAKDAELEEKLEEKKKILRGEIPDDKREEEKEEEEESSKAMDTSIQIDTTK